MISSAQAVEHYEWLLQQNLEEEKNADRLLSRIAKISANPNAVAAE